MTEIFQAYGRDRVPFLVQLAEEQKYVWAPSFAKGREIVGDTNKLQDQKKALQSRPMPKAEFVAAATAEFDAAEVAHIQKFARLINRHRRNALMGPLIGGRLDPLPERRHFEMAIDIVMPADHPDAISTTDLKTEIKKIDAKISKLRKELDSLDMQGYYLLADAAIGEDARATLVNFWEGTQGRVNAACSPRGIDLNNCPEYEKEAYKILGIAKHINPKSRFSPHPG